VSSSRRLTVRDASIKPSPCRHDGPVACRCPGRLCLGAADRSFLLAFVPSPCPAPHESQAGKADSNPPTNYSRRRALATLILHHHFNLIRHSRELSRSPLSLLERGEPSHEAAATRYNTPHPGSIARTATRCTRCANDLGPPRSSFFLAWRRQP
jgi:hypothetical protein